MAASACVAARRDPKPKKLKFYSTVLQLASSTSPVASAPWRHTPCSIQNLSFGVGVPSLLVLQSASGGSPA